MACDFIIAAAGVRPEIRFLEHCSVETGRAVTVDQYLSTSVPGVYGPMCAACPAYGPTP
ncbi:MAG: FAD-dependent oxidoreductase [Enterocloster bolteae]